MWQIRISGFYSEIHIFLNILCSSKNPDFPDFCENSSEREV